MRGKGKLVKVIRVATETLAGIPSIVYGLFGYLVFVVTFGWGYSLLGGGITLAIMILPVLVRSTEESLLSVPAGYREGALALGASKVRTIFTVVLPAAASGIDGGDPCDRARDQRKRCADFNDRHGGEQNARVDDVPGNEPCAGYLLFREQRLSEAGGCHGGGAFIACGRAESSCDGRGKTFEEKNGREVTLWKTKRYNKKKLRKRKIFP